MTNNDSISVASITLDGVDNLVFMLNDNLPWEQLDKTDFIEEKQHLLLLQDSINECISYIQNENHKKDYPDKNIRNAFVEIHFKYSFTEHCKRYLQLIHNQLEQYGIKIEVYVGERISQNKVL